MTAGSAPFRLDIITVNWNGGPLPARCVASVPAALTEGVELRRFVIVDNASTDGSADGLEAVGPASLTVLRNDVNRGFSAACNQGAAGSDADWLLFLNPDTELNAGSLAPLGAWLAEPAQARIGAAGVRLTDEEGRTQRCCARAPTPWRLLGQSVGLDRFLPRLFPPHFMSEWDHETTRPVDQVMGAFLLVRRDLFERLGGFDERFFVYYDDVDLCLEIRRAGWDVVHFAGAHAYHKGGGTTDKVKATRLFYLWRSRSAFAGKHFSLPGRLTVLAATLLAEPAARLARAALRGRGDELSETLGAMRMLWRALIGGR
jgi:N-acetylglucosaminyl-diphospho-decaprenol L-rhamnosyltransferase